MATTVLPPSGMNATNNFQFYRTTFHWDRLAYAYGAGDYSKATMYHWLHSDGLNMSGILESVKKPLEGRVWYDYGSGDPVRINSAPNKARHIGRILDEGTAQLHTYSHNNFGNVTSYTDPVGRTTSWVYDTNGIDLVEIHQTTGPQSSDLLARYGKYNGQHRPMTRTDAAGQTTNYTYNARGQVTTVTDPLNQMTTYNYDPNGYLTSVVGPLSGQSVSYTYDPVGRIRTRTNESGYSLTFDYDNLDRLTRITYPDSTSVEFNYAAGSLDPTLIVDRAGRESVIEYDSFRHPATVTDPSGQITTFGWCKCGDIRSVTDHLGRTTQWNHDLQGRVQSKQYPDGSKITYRYEDSTSRLRQRIDEQLQVTTYAHNLDNTLAQIDYTNPANPARPTRPVLYTYDPDYKRVTKVANDVETTCTYAYVPPNTHGAGQLQSVATVEGGAITYTYDELGRRKSTDVNGATSTIQYDAAGRIEMEVNPLGTFVTNYDGASRHPVSRNGPVSVQYTYAPAQQDFALTNIANLHLNSIISQFDYGHDTPTGRITRWNQTSPLPAGKPDRFDFKYDNDDQLVEVFPFVGGQPMGHFTHAYDAVGNRTVIVDPNGATTNLWYNTLNQLTTINPIGTSGPYIGYACTFDAEQRLAAIAHVGGTPANNHFDYDHLGRFTAIHDLNVRPPRTRRFVWDRNQIRAELDGNGAVVKYFFPQGMQIVSGPDAGLYYYTRDHLRSIREVVDGTGTVRAQYLYDAFGQAEFIGPGANIVEPDFGFAGMFRLDLPGGGINLTRHRAYDPSLGRWISRDPLYHAELRQGPNLYTYVGNNPVNLRDPSGQGPWEEFWVRAFTVWRLFTTDVEDEPEREYPTTVEAPPEPFPPPPPPPPPKPPDSELEEYLKYVTEVLDVVAELVGDLLGEFFPLIFVGDPSKLGPGGCPPGA
jgi:RHS repeat-associated protein